MNSITYTTAGATQTVLQTSVTRMNQISDAFYVEGAGSTLSLEFVTVEQNTAEAPWSAISVRAGALAVVSETSISNNSAVEFVVVVFNSIVTITDSFISQNTGSVRSTCCTSDR